MRIRLVRFANPIPIQKIPERASAGTNVTSKQQQQQQQQSQQQQQHYAQFNEQRAFDSDDGAAKIRREQRMRRFKMLEARK